MVHLSADKLSSVVLQFVLPDRPISVQTHLLNFGMALNSAVLYEQTRRFFILSDNCIFPEGRCKTGHHEG